MTPISFQIPANGSNSTPSAVTTAIGAGATSVFTIGHNNIIRVIASTPVNIRFGPTGLTTATVQDILIPAGVAEFFDMGRQHECIAVFATAASSFNYAIVSRT